MCILKKAYVVQRITNHAKRYMCSTSNGEGYSPGYSLHAFPRDKIMWKKGIRAIKRAKRVAKQLEWANHLKTN